TFTRGAPIDTASASPGRRGSPERAAGCRRARSRSGHDPSPPPIPAIADRTSATPPSSRRRTDRSGRPTRADQEQEPRPCCSRIHYERLGLVFLLAISEALDRRRRGWAEASEAAPELRRTARRRTGCQACWRF